MHAWTYDIYIREHFEDIRDEVATARLVSQIARRGEQAEPERNLAFTLFDRILRTRTYLSRRVAGWSAHGSVRVEEQYEAAAIDVRGA
jgi:hypothetical protein